MTSLRAEVGTNHPVKDGTGRRLWGIIAALALVSGGLRALPVATAPIWTDETYSLHVIDPNAAGSLWAHVANTESTPPLYYALSAGVRALGVDGILSIRLIPLLAAAAAVMVAFWAARQFFADRVAVVVALLAAIHPMISGFAIDGRSYSLLILISFGLTGLFGRLLARPDRRSLLAWAVLATVGCWTHYFAALLVVVATVLLLLIRPEVRKPVFLATAGWAILCLPLLSLLPRQNDARSGWIGSSGLMGRVTKAGRDLLGVSPNLSNATEALALALVAVLVLFALACAVRAARGFTAIRTVTSEMVLSALVAVIVLVPLMLSLASARLDKFDSGNLVIALPALMMLVAAGAQAGRLVARLALCGLIVLMLLSSGLALYDWHYGQTDIAGALDRAGPSIGAAPILTTESPPAVLSFLLERAAMSPAETVTTDRFEVLLPPARIATRTLQPVPIPPAIAQLKALGFKITLNTLHHGVRRLQLSASAPIGVPGGSLMPLSVLLPAPLVEPALQRALLGQEWGAAGPGAGP